MLVRRGEMSNYFIPDSFSPEMLHRIDTVVYYSAIVLGVLAACYMMFKMLRKLEPDLSKARLFSALVFLFYLGTGFFSSRAANLFYLTSAEWSLDSFWIEALEGQLHTFHASLVLPVMGILGLIWLLRLELWSTLDAVFVSLPLAHSIGRLGCLWTGCCWGREVTLALGSWTVQFVNPVPLYSSAFNLSLFLLLRKCFLWVYCGNQRHLKGIVVALYLFCYGVFRWLIELIRIEKRIAWHMTQAQWVMLLFIGIGIAISAAIVRRTRQGNGRSRE